MTMFNNSTQSKTFHVSVHVSMWPNTFCLVETGSQDFPTHRCSYPHRSSPIDHTHLHLHPWMQNVELMVILGEVTHVLAGSPKIQ